MLEVRSAFGLLVLVAFAWALGERRLMRSWRVAIVGIALQIALAVLLLKVPLLADAVRAVNGAVDALDAATKAGTTLVFGYLGGGQLPFKATQPGADFILAFRALPLLLVVSALSALLTYWRILPWIVRGFSIVLERSFRIGGAVGLATGANVFVGMLEAPLFVRPYLERLTRSELFILMTAGMATIAGTVYVLYSVILGPVIPDAASELLVASVISAPAAITVALLMVPETEASTTGRELPPSEATSAMDALVQGTERGIVMLLNIIAMLIVLVALVHLANAVLGLLPDVASKPVTLQRLLAYPLTPVCWLMGVPWVDSFTAAQLLSTKVILNEIVAYLDLAALPKGALDERSRLIMVYAMCGFANFGSVGIMVGGLSAAVPQRRGEIVALGLKSMVAGVIATCLTGCVIGLLT